MAPLQRQLRALAASATGAGDFDWPRYRSLARSWEAWGAFSLLTPVAALVLMVLEPL